MTCRLMLVIAAGAVAALSQPAAAQSEDAPYGYGVFRIQNPHRVAIRYQVKWGANEWKSFTVSPGSTRWHSYPLDAECRTPRPAIRFDWHTADDECTFRTYNLNTYVTRDPSNGGKAYYFEYSSCGCYLDLKARP